MALDIDGKNQSLILIEADGKNPIPPMVLPEYEDPNAPAPPLA
jgi:hypothetical protein